MSAFQKLRASAHAQHDKLCKDLGRLPCLMLSSTSYASQLRRAFHQQVQAVVPQLLAGCCVGIDSRPAQVVNGPDFLLAIRRQACQAKQAQAQQALHVYLGYLALQKTLVLRRSARMSPCWQAAALSFDQTLHPSNMPGTMRCITYCATNAKEMQRGTPHAVPWHSRPRAAIPEAVCLISPHPSTTQSRQLPR